MIEVKLFSATWCGPCRAFYPIFEELKSEFPDIEFTKIDIDENKALAMEYKIRAVPTLIIDNDGALDELVGVPEKSTVVTLLEQSLKDGC